MPTALPLTLVGHPFAPIGRGEDLRATARAMKAAGLRPAVLNAYGGATTDEALFREFAPDLVEHTGGGIDVFILNGDEIQPVTAHLGSRIRPAERTIVFPTWELPRYPREWAERLLAFDDIWVTTEFVRQAVRDAAGRDARVVLGAAGARLKPFRGRRDFGIPESPFAFLFGFDLRSFVERKNPLAVVDAFGALCRSRPALDTVLVIKMSGGAERPDEAREFRRQLTTRLEGAPIDRVRTIETDLTDSDTKNLVRSADVFVSLHRSEGLGRFLAEAMLLGKPVIATNYSGNVDFMADDVACLVEYRLVPVAPGAYPHWEHQVWADPDVAQAADWMRRLSDDRTLARAIGARASRHARRHLSHRAIGLRMRSCLEDPALAGPEPIGAHD
jgi:glycosyltransferase involved in cell wall biosynthesis